MRIFRERCVFFGLVVLVLSSTACAQQSSCVFDEGSFTKDRYEKNSAISKFVWADSAKEVKGITNDGAMFSIKHWSCDHYGTHALLFLGPYMELDSSNVNKEFLKLANLALDGEELKVVKKELNKNVIAISSDKNRHNLAGEEYSEFYFSYRVSDDVVILEIKFYRD